MAGERTVIIPAVKLRRPASPLPRGQGAADTRPEWVRKSLAVLHYVGGWRQVTFAFGLAFLLGGIGDPFDCAIMLFMGGLLVGMSLRIPWLRG